MDETACRSSAKCREKYRRERERETVGPGGHVTSQGRGLPFHSTLITLYNARVYDAGNCLHPRVCFSSLLRDDEAMACLEGMPRGVCRTTFEAVSNLCIKVE